VYVLTPRKRLGEGSPLRERLASFVTLAASEFYSTLCRRHSHIFQVLAAHHKMQNFAPQAVNTLNRVVALAHSWNLGA
jgi:hypothetical protein